MSFKMEVNGSLGYWKSSNGIDILHPEIEQMFGGCSKLRGGAPVCAPNFGDAPKGGPYRRTRLPKHGLVRDCLIENGKKPRKNKATRQSGPHQSADGWVSTGFQFNHPWPHTVQVSAQEEQSLAIHGETYLRHRIAITPDVVMPCSIGFHPYFATQGETFSLHYYERRWKMDEIPVNEAFFVQGQPNERFVVSTCHGYVEMELHGGYNGYYVWTNDPSSYICVEPVCIGCGLGFRMVDPGETLECACSLKYFPKS